MEILLLRGSEKFISIATKDKGMIKNLSINNNIEGKSQMEPTYFLKICSQRESKYNSTIRIRQKLFVCKKKRKHSRRKR